MILQYSRTGADLLTGGTRHDLLYGDAGRDRLSGGPARTSWSSDVPQRRTGLLTSPAESSQVWKARRGMSQRPPVRIDGIVPSRTSP